MYKCGMDSGSVVCLQYGDLNASGLAASAGLVFTTPHDLAFATTTGEANGVFVLPFKLTLLFLVFQAPCNQSTCAMVVSSRFFSQPRLSLDFTSLVTVQLC